MTAEQVRMSRAAGLDRVLLMAGQTTHYAIEPRGEYVFGLVTGQSMRSWRGRERRVIKPGQLLAWDPSGPHAGAAIDGRAWTARLMVIEAADLTGLCGDEDLRLPAGIAFPEPVICDPRLAADFLALHTALETPAATQLERDQRLAEWLCALTEHSPAARPYQSPLSPRDDKALRLARDYLADQPERNISLDELATAAGTGRHRLIRLFRQRTGLPPHALQLAHRIRTARRLLEAGRTPAQAATAAGFTDQSHLHRHFRRSLGMTPAEYQRRFLQPGQR
jgi:AraC-like DNA-binding protein